MNRDTGVMTDVVARVSLISTGVGADLEAGGSVKPSKGSRPTPSDHASDSELLEPVLFTQLFRWVQLSCKGCFIISSVLIC